MRRLIEVLGEEEAETLMESLPPVAWSQIATKDDLGELEKRLMSAMDTRFTEFRNEFTDFKSEMRDEFTDFKSEIRIELADQRGEWKTELARNTRTVVLSFVGVTVAMLGAMVAIMVALAQTGALAA